MLRASDLPGLRHPGLRAGQANWFTPVSALPSTTTAAVVAGTLYLAPFWLPGLTVNRIAVEPTAAAGQLRIGLYGAVPGDNVPGPLLVDWGALALASNQLLELAVADWVMPSEVAWLALLPDAAPTLRIGSPDNAWFFGSANLSAGAPRGLGLAAAGVGYGALPAAAPTAAISATVPLAGLRKV